MEPAEKNPRNKPAAPLPNPGRRAFLRNVLLASAAGCSSSKSDSPQPATVHRGREFSVGGSSVVLESCKGSSADFTIRGKAGKKASVSMLVPGSLFVPPDRPQYEVYVESTSPATQSAEVLITKKAVREENASREGISAEVPLAGAAFALASFFVAWAIGRRKEREIPEDGIGMVLSPKRRH